MSARPAPTVERLDLVALIGAQFVALLSFHAAFSGAMFFVAGATGAVLAAAYWTWALRHLASASFRTLGALAAFALVGPVATARNDAVAGFLPSLTAIGAVFNGAVHGWWTLVTTLPPVGQAGHVLVVPYLCGFAGVSASLLLLRWRRVPILAAIPPILVLGLGVLVGTDRSGSLFVEGGLLLAILLLWASSLDRRARPIIGTVRRGRGLVGSTALLGVVALAAGLVGAHVPFTHSRARYVLRDHVQPPFDPTQYPSPLAGFRIYRVKKNQNQPLLRVDGVTTKARLRIATMDDYDGLVWRVGDAGALDAFRRVGTSLPDGTSRTSETITVTIKNDLHSVWLPLIGQPSQIKFDGADAGELASNLRYNSAQSTAADSSELHKGDRFTMKTLVTADSTVDGVSIAPALPPVNDQTIFNTFSDKAGAIVKSANDPRAEASAIAQAFSHGAYDDGPLANTPPGHFLARISEFLREPQPVGDAEQYAAAAAILLHARQAPARVVLGVKLEPNHSPEYKYSDVTAWIEIPVAGRGWVAYDVTPSTKNMPKKQPLPKQQHASQQPPPQPPRASLSANSGSASSTQSATRRKILQNSAHHGGLGGLLLGVAGVALIPILFFGAPIALILTLKRRRRNGRRLAPTTALQITGGWDEVVDLLRDLGRPVPAKATRRELATVTEADGLSDLASYVDESVFGDPDPSEHEARCVWDEVIGIRQRLAGSIGRLDRIRCALSLTSLRTER
jgi:hypothetical protein